MVQYNFKSLFTLREPESMIVIDISTHLGANLNLIVQVNNQLK